MRRKVGSEIAVVAAVITLLAAGALLASSALGATHMISRRGVVITVPERWIVGEEAGEIIAQAWHPSLPNRTIIVRDHFMLGGEPTTVVQSSHAERARRDASFRVLADGDEQFAGTDAYRVDYAYLDDEDGRLPVVVVGRVFALGLDERRVVTVAYEAPAGETDELFGRIPELSVRRVE